MQAERRILIDPRGAILGAGQKVVAIEGLQRASNETRRVFDAWYRCRQGGRFPKLSDVYPGELGDLLASIVVVDVLADAQDYRYRNVGALEIETRLEDPTGRTVREVNAGNPEVLCFCLENYDLAAGSPCGVIDFSVEASVNPRYLELETLLLPLSEDGVRVTQILVYSHYVEH
jgi:hypothetical protein